MGFLKMIGLVTAEEHAKVVRDHDEARADLSACKHDLEIANAAVAGSAEIIQNQRAEIAALRPDAEAMRNKRKRDRELKAEKRQASPQPVAQAVSRKKASR